MLFTGLIILYARPNPGCILSSSLTRKNLPLIFLLVFLFRMASGLPIRVVHERKHDKQVFYVLSVESILCKLLLATRA